MTIRNEDVCIWYSSLKPASRIEFLSGFLRLLLPWELRFIGSCLEDLARRDFHVFRESEQRANNLSVMQRISSLHSFTSDEFRALLAVSLALLHSTNVQCATLYSDVLLWNFELARELVRYDEVSRQDIILLYHMAINHPAFTFDQRQTLCDCLRILQQIEKESTFISAGHQQVITQNRKPKCYKIVNEMHYLSDFELQKRFRFDKTGIDLISSIVGPDLIKHHNNGRPISVHTQVMISLRYLASNDFQIGVADDFSISQMCVSTILANFVDSLIKHFDEYIVFPGEDKRRESTNNFYKIARFPKVIGCIDGTNIRIASPALQDSESYINRKNFHSIYVQAVCDHQMKFINVVAKWPGSNHDSFILKQSELWEVFESHQVRNCHLLGDSGYPFRDWLLTPFLDIVSDTQNKYNEALKKTRILVEQSFGVLKRGFSILHSEIRLKPSKCCKVIVCCFILHNIARDLKLTDLEEITEVPSLSLDAPNAAETILIQRTKNSVAELYFGDV